MAHRNVSHGMVILAKRDPGISIALTGCVWPPTIAVASHALSARSGKPLVMRTATFSASDDIGVGHPFIWAHTESGSDRVPCGKWLRTKYTHFLQHATYPNQNLALNA